MELSLFFNVSLFPCHGIYSMLSVGTNKDHGPFASGLLIQDVLHLDLLLSGPFDSGCFGDVPPIVLYMESESWDTKLRIMPPTKP
jgi:hypothetical protein